MSESRLPAGILRPRYWPRWAVMGLLWLWARLPYPIAMKLGLLFGRALYPLARGRREVALRNLELCFPELDAAQRERLAKLNFAYTGKAFAEIAFAWYASPERLRGLAEIRGTEHVERALAQGKGVILLSAHFTCLEMTPPLVSPVVPSYAIYKPQRHPVNEYCMRSARDRSLLGSITRDDVRGMLRALKKNKPVWYAADQDYGRSRSVFAPFFGIPTATVAGLTRLVAISGAQVIPFFFYSRPDHSGYIGEFHPPLENLGKDPVADATVVNRVTEEAVRQRPEQYLWTHRRFKTRPNRTDPKLYQLKKRRKRKKQRNAA